MMAGSPTWAKSSGTTIGIFGLRFSGEDVNDLMQYLKSL